MQRWKALPEELGPQVREFAVELRKLVDRSGLSTAAVADRTGYSTVSWENYLNGRQLAPRAAMAALAEVTGTDPARLAAAWERADRAWRQPRSSHDLSADPAGGPQARGAPGPAPVRVPGMAGDRAPARPDTRPDPGQDAVHRSASPPRPRLAGPPADHPAGRPPVSTVPGKGRGGRKAALFVTGLVGALLVIAGALLLTDLGGDDGGRAAAARPSPLLTPTPAIPLLPAGVECAGDSCTGKDPENMGCGGQFATTLGTALVGRALIEVRYSDTCGAAWARISQASPGDRVRIDYGPGRGAPGNAAPPSASVDTERDAYTPMTAVRDPTTVRACATLVTGAEGCTPR